MLTKLLLIQPIRSKGFENIKFSWAVCGKFFFDAELQAYILALSPKARLYHKPSGRFYSVLPDTRILISPNSKDFTRLKKIDPTLLGRAFSEGCFPCSSLGRTSKGICCKASFHLPLKALRQLDSGRCEIIQEAKMRNTEYIKKNKDFPSIKKIDDLIAKEGCERACKVLYSFMK